MTFDARQLGCKCDTCPLRDRANPIWPGLPAHRSRAPKLLLFGEGPGPTEEAFGAYFVGKSGELLDDVLGYIGSSREELHIGNVTLCRPWKKMGPTEWRQTVDACAPQVDLQLQHFKTKSILAYGKWSMYRFLGRENIFAWAGAPIQNEAGYTVLATLHPAFSLRKQGWPYRPVLYVHTQRAVQMARGELPEWKWPPFYLEPNKTAVAALKRILKANLPVALDVETQGTDPLTSNVMSIGVANQNEGVSVPWQSYRSKQEEVAPLASYPLGAEIESLYRQILASKELWCQNGIHDIMTVGRLGLEVGNYTFDTMLAHTVVAQGRKHDLGWISCEEYHAPRWKEEKHTASNEKGAAKFANRKPLELRLYNAKDCYMTVLDGVALRKRLDDEPSGWAVMDSYMTNSKIAMKMFQYGVRKSAERARYHRPRIMANRAAARRDLITVAESVDAYNFNPDSHRGVDDLLRKRMKVIPTKYSEITGEPSWDEGALTSLLASSNQLVSVVARALLRYRRWATLLKYTAIPTDANGVVHVTWKPSGAKTMRWSSSPNLQNIPISMRDMFVPMHKDGWVVRADYDQLELRIATLLSGAEELQAVFETGADPHWLNAKIMFGEEACANPSEKAYKDMRDMAKMGAYQMMYGGSPEALWKRIIIEFPQMTLGRCQSIHHRWFDRNHEFVTWHHALMQQALSKRYIEAPVSGHRYYFFGAAEESFVYNYPVQHSAADIINPCVKPIADSLNWKTESILAQIHDELALEGKNPIKLGRLLMKHMNRTIEYDGRSMKFPVSLKVGRNMKDCIEVKPSQSLKAAIELLSRTDIDFGQKQKLWKKGGGK